MDLIIRTVQYKKILEKVDWSTPYVCTYSVSPYIGCEYDCVYCCKSKDTQLPGEGSSDLSGVVQVKENASEILRRELKGLKKGVVCVTGYQKIEKETKLIRKMLEVLNSRLFPVHIITMSDIVLDDMDLLSEIVEKNWGIVSIRTNTLDKKISKIFEPNSITPKNRIATLGTLTEKGITAGLVISPVIPYVTDSKEVLEDIIKKAAEKNASYIIVEPLKLKDQCRARVIEIIKRHYPELLLKYKNLYEFGSSPEIRYANKLKNRVNYLLKKYEMLNSVPTFSTGQKRKQARIKDFFQ